MPRHVCIMLHDLSVGIPGRNVVIELAAAAGNPSRPVVPELHTAERRIVPQQSVAQARHHKRHHMLYVPLVEVNDRALQVDSAGGIETHAIEALAGARRQVPLGFEQAVARGLKNARAGIVRAHDVVVLTYNQFLLASDVLEELQMALLGINVVDLRGNLPVPDGGFRRADLDFAPAPGRDIQSPVRRLATPARNYPHPQAIISPCFDHYCLTVTVVNQPTLFVLHIHEFEVPRPALYYRHRTYFVKPW